MAYCSECGIYYTGEEDICPSCGKNVIRNHKPERKPLLTEEIEVPSTLAPGGVGFENQVEDNGDLKNGQETPRATLPELSGPDQIISNVDDDKINLLKQPREDIYFQNESQLGKGIIKPQKVEMALDGVHFKYETPAHSFLKEGPVKEKPKEYRVTSADMEQKLLDENFLEKTSQEEELPASSIVEQAENLKRSSEEKLEEEILIETGDKPGEILAEEGIEPEGLTTDSKSELIAEPVISEFIAEPVLPEPELQEANDKVEEDIVVWEGVQSWLKIPLGNQYRLTRRSLIIFDKNYYKLFDVGLSLISEISVKQSWIAKLFNIGDLLVSIPDFAATEVILGGISEPYKVKRMIEQLIKDG